MAIKAKRTSGKIKKQVKSKQVQAPEPPNSDVGLALHGLAKGTGEIAEELHHLFYLDPISDNLAALASNLNHLANATAMSVIAQHGTAEVKEKAVAYLMTWFEEFRD